MKNPFKNESANSTPTSAGSSGTSGPANFFGKKDKKASRPPSASSSPDGKKSSRKSEKGSAAAAAAPPAGGSKAKKYAAAAGAAAILGGAGYAVWKYALGSPASVAAAKEGLDDFTNVLKDGLEGLDFGELFEKDPKEGDPSVYVWRSDFVRPGDGGLHLTILNALDDTWQGEFEDAVSDWKESRALTLDAERVDVDYDCTRQSGVMVVCNANFGETGWVGINQNEIKKGEIVSSVTKMNEYYLRNAEYAHRRYTMCHEVGHGFGLPHTDEDPYNDNLGNCLDYTVTPEENLYPGSVNIKKLAGMYLNRRKLRRVEGEDGTVIETHMLVVDWDKVEIHEDDVEV